MVCVTVTYDERGNNGTSRIIGNPGFFFVRADNSQPDNWVYKITHALQLGCHHGIEETLIKISGTWGFESPGPAFRRWAVQRWAHRVGGKQRVAMVARPEHICPEKTGLLIAAEEGLQADICKTEAEAIRWLDAGSDFVTESCDHQRRPLKPEDPSYLG